MTENCRLMPGSMKEQSETAISRLQTENSHLCTSNAALDAFINDRSNIGQSFSNVRQKMSDFRMASDALIEANVADIDSHRRIIASVGDQILNGLHILETLDNAITLQNDAIDNVAYYDRRLRTAIRGRSCLRENRNTWAEVRDSAILVIRNMEQKIDDFHRADIATRGIFTAAEGLRTTARQGLRLIREAAAGLPNSYGTENLSRWRDEIRNAKEQFELQRLLAELLPEGGSPNWERIAEILNRPYDQISPIEYYAISQVFASLESDGDLTKLVQLLADPVTISPMVPGSFGFDPDFHDNTPIPLHEHLWPPGVGIGSEAVYWVFCPEKINRIQFFLNVEAATLISQTDGIYDETRINRLLERSALLSTVSVLTNPIAGEGNFSNSNTVLGDANGPMINITASSDRNVSYLVNFHSANIIVTHNPAHQQIPSVTLHDPQQNTIAISPAVDCTRISTIVRENAEAHVRGEFPVDLRPDGFGGFASDMIKKAGDAAMGKYRYPLDIALSLYNNFIENPANRANQNVLNNVIPGFEDIYDAAFHGRFDFYAVVINSGNAQSDVILTPSPSTYARVEVINEFIRENDLASSLPGELEYPVNIGDAMQGTYLREFVESRTRQERRAMGFGNQNNEGNE